MIKNTTAEYFRNSKNNRNPGPNCESSDKSQPILNSFWTSLLLSMTAHLFLYLIDSSHVAIFSSSYSYYSICLSAWNTVFLAINFFTSLISNLIYSCVLVWLKLNILGFIYFLSEFDISSPSFYTLKSEMRFNLRLANIKAQLHLA